RHHGDGLALEVGRFFDAGIGAHHELHEALAAEQANDLHRHAVLSDDNGRVGDDAAERHIAGAHLLRDVNAAAAGSEIDGEPGLLEITLALSKPDRPE